jgi:hypothetical protein
MGLEIGGANGMEPFLVGSSRFFDATVLDADWMGRALQVTPSPWDPFLNGHTQTDPFHSPTYW